MTKKKVLLITPIDKQAQIDGAWTQYHGTDLKICRATNPIFKKLMIGAQAEDMSYLDPQQREDRIAVILSKNMAEGLLVDWANFPGDVSYSRESAAELLLNDDDCRVFVLNFSGEVENYYKDKVQTILEK